MNKTNSTVASTKGMSKLERARFGPGMLLQHEDLDLLNSYTRDLSRLLFKSFFGCGVVCGLVVTVDSKCGKVCVTVRAGVALACSGDPIAVPKDQTFALDENCDPSIKGPLWVVLCGTTKQCAPRTSMCASDDDEAPSVPTRERDGFEIRVVNKRPDCACGCPEPKTENEVRVGETDCKCVKPYQPNKPDDPVKNCYDSHYDGKCGCNCDECSDCDCKCILLAQLIKNEDDKEHPWHVDHRVRRFIRPVLMRDPQVEIEEQSREEAQSQSYSSQRSTSVESEKMTQNEAPSVMQEAVSDQTKKPSVSRPRKRQ